LASNATPIEEDTFLPFQRSKKPDTAMPLREMIGAEFARVAAEHDKTLAPLSDELPLLDMGLDSLCFAIVVARLEDALGIDPFGSAAEVEFPVTFGDFIRLYEDASK
jgi:hypothetical protein